MYISISSILLTYILTTKRSFHSRHIYISIIKGTKHKILLKQKNKSQTCFIQLFFLSQLLIFVISQKVMASIGKKEVKIVQFVQLQMND